MGLKFTHQVPNDLHNPFAATPLWTILDYSDQSQFGANSENGPLSHNTATIFLLALLWRKSGEEGLGRGSKRCGKRSDESWGESVREATVQCRDDLRRGVQRDEVT